MEPNQLHEWLRAALQTKTGPDAWLLDVDDTITDTRKMHHNAASAITEALSDRLSSGSAAEVSRRFAEIFDELLVIHQGTSEPGTPAFQSAEKLEARARNHQREISEKWGIARLFSREVLLRMAVEDCHAALTPAHLRHCTDRYWEHALENPVFFPDAIHLAQWLGSSETPVYLMTSSDARYHELENGQFSYDPEESRLDKRKRIENLRRHGIDYADAFIGDPIDKPSEEFFQHALSTISQELNVDEESISVVMVGDSYRSDIKTPVGMLGTAIGVVYDRGRKGVDVKSERVISIGDLEMLIGDNEAMEGKG